MDSDMLVRDDISKLFELADPQYDVMCIQHAYTPAAGDKFLNQEQTSYTRKNWSSVMLFNNASCTRLDPEYVNEARGLELHQFNWTDKIGELPRSWNHLVGEYPEYTDASIAHFTLGGPYFKAYESCEYADEWWRYWREANSVLDVKTLEGQGCSEALKRR
jgi:lipopolysaccharide biosynthesis glycosyltransferase